MGWLLLFTNLAICKEWFHFQPLISSSLLLGSWSRDALELLPLQEVKVKMPQLRVYDVQALFSGLLGTSTSSPSCIYEALISRKTRTSSSHGVLLVLHSDFSYHFDIIMNQWLHLVISLGIWITWNIAHWNIRLGTLQNALG